MCLSRSLMLLFFCIAIGKAKGDDLTFTNSFAADNSLFSYSLTTATSQEFTFYTTSYAGGMNANRTITGAGGFVPVLTLFSSTGSVVDFGGASGFLACGTGIAADRTTGLCKDAKFTDVLKPGTYQLVLSEFPNVPSGNPSAGFLGARDPTFTGDNCGVTGRMFLEADISPCVQRNANYTVNTPATSSLKVGLR